MIAPIDDPTIVHFWQTQERESGKRLPTDRETYLWELAQPVRPVDPADTLPGLAMALVMLVAPLLWALACWAFVFLWLPGVLP